MAFRLLCFRRVQALQVLGLQRCTSASFYSIQSRQKSTLVDNDLKTDELLHPQKSTLGSPDPQLDLTFSNAQEAYKSKNNSELIRAMLVFNLCSITPLVTHNKKLLKWSRNVLGKQLFERLMKATFYGQFVGGEDRKAVRPLVLRNKLFGVKSILDYSAEEDVTPEKAQASMKGSVPSKTVMEELSKDRGGDPEREKFIAHPEFADRGQKVISSRTYFYEGEEQCDKNMQIFLDSIDGVSDATEKTGLCAIKLTALGRPQLLLQMSDVLVSSRNLFMQVTGNTEDIFLRRFGPTGFRTALQEMGVKVSEEDMLKWFSMLDLTGDGEVDLLDWDNLLEVNMNLSKLFVVPNLQTGHLDPLVIPMTTETEQELRNMLHRIDTIVKYAADNDVRIMVDAEQTYFQPAISRLTMEMMKKFNKEKAVIFNTYQCYLKQAYDNIRIDMENANRFGFYFGAKLVRGAYMEQERERAEKIGYEDPINPTYEATTEMYHKVLEEVMRQIQRRQRGKVAVMVASHNENTVKFTVEKMKEYDVKPLDNVICFGQLLGMCDQVSFPLGQAGYSVYKYVPYGPVDEVVPYLSRRAMENKGILKKVKKEKSLLRQELWRRIKSGKLMYTPSLEPIAQQVKG